MTPAYTKAQIKLIAREKDTHDKKVTHVKKKYYKLKRNESGKLNGSERVKMGCVCHRYRIQPDDIIVKPPVHFYSENTVRTKVTLITREHLRILNDLRELPCDSYQEYTPNEQKLKEMRYSQFADLLENPHLDFKPFEQTMGIFAGETKQRRISAAI